MKKSICVILCSYNGERFIRPQIDSILAQSSDISQLTLHIFDDCSSDRTRPILESYSREYPDRVFVHLRQTPCRACRNFLLALREVPDADLYMFCDQDDVWRPDKVSRMLKFFLSRTDASDGKERPILVFSDAQVAVSARDSAAEGAAACPEYAAFDPDLRIAAPSFVSFQKLSPQRTQLNRLLMMNQVTGAACMFNHCLRDLLISVPLPEHAIMHDHFMALTAAAFGEIYYLNRPLYAYRQHESNVLGAQKGGMVLEIRKRLGLAGRSKDEMDEASRNSYDALFDQAGEFLKLYRSRLDDTQLDMLRAFMSLKGLDRLQKIIVIMKYGFTFNKFYRTIGECLFI